jgi:hypothetical protein
MSLYRYFLNNNKKVIHKWVHYFDIYERHFARFKDKAPVVLEIGVFKGGSMQMWKDYFGPGTKIIGIDIDPTCKQHEEEGVEIFIGNQDCPGLINTIFNKYQNIDIVIDDGGHHMKPMVNSFNLIYDRVNPNGVYLVEDTHTCYWEEYEGGLKLPSSFMEFTKNKLDEINAVHSRGTVPITKFTKSTDLIACYDSIVVFERKPQSERQALFMP